SLVGEFKLKAAAVTSKPEGTVAVVGGPAPVAPASSSEAAQPWSAIKDTGGTAVVVGLVIAGLTVLAFGFYRKASSTSHAGTDLAFKISYANGSQAIHRLQNKASIRVGRAKDNDLILDDEYI